MDALAFRVERRKSQGGAAPPRAWGYHERPIYLWQYPGISGVGERTSGDRAAVAQSWSGCAHPGAVCAAVWSYTVPESYWEGPSRHCTAVAGTWCQKGMRL